MSEAAAVKEGERARVLAALGRLKVFPLPGAVLLPGALVPLHIFEPRYRKMIRDCSAGDGVLALAQLAPQAAGGPGPQRVLPVLGAGILERVETLPDGRFNVLLKGIVRARIREELPQSEPYRVVAADALLDDESDAGSPALLKACESLRALLLALCAARPEAEAEALARAAGRAAGPSELADLAAGALLESPQEKQAVLEALRVSKRIELVSSSAATQLARSMPRQGHRGKLLN